MLIYLLTVISFYDLAISGAPCAFDGLQLTAGSATYSLAAGDTCTMSTEATIVGSGPPTTGKFNPFLVAINPVQRILTNFYLLFSFNFSRLAFNHLPFTFFLISDALFFVQYLLAPKRSHVVDQMSFLKSLARCPRAARLLQS